MYASTSPRLYNLVRTWRDGKGNQQGIGGKLRLPNEPIKPFAYIGLISDSNGIDINQTNEYIEISCPNYIDRLLRSHHWETPERQPSAKPIAPLYTNAIENMYKNVGPIQGT